MDSESSEQSNSETAELVRVHGSNSAHSVRWRGQIKTLQEWAEHLGVKYNRLYTRYFRYKWDLTYVMETATDPRPKGVHMAHFADPEVRKKAAEGRRLAQQSPEHKEKMERRRQGLSSEPELQGFRVNADINPLVWADRQGKHRVGTKHTEETRAKMTEAREGLVNTPETISKRILSNSGRKQTRESIKKDKRGNIITQRAKAAGIEWKEMDKGEQK